ncbi:MAG TPA: hypothetical protein VGX23_15855 [Actinocrinis sp.]|nr:hypothetical protein [Actinocrinis sp.]
MSSNLTVPDDDDDEDDDLTLLRANEPMLAFTRGELFLPISVGRYVARCSLRGRHGDSPAAELVPAGQLTLDRLARARAEFPGWALSLLLVQRPADRRAVRAAHKARVRVVNRSAKLAAVGLIARIVAVLLRVSLKVRGSVPGGVSTEAARIDGESFLQPDTCTYYGRVVRTESYVALQYWFFYAMNDWRSTFGGINDHEADWETLTVFLDPDDLRPRWIAFSSHDYVGDDLRRRWDDPDLAWSAGHPVIFAGAGSHSGAAQAGDYLVRVRPRFVTGLVHALRSVVARLAPWLRPPKEEGIGIPFIDYARGDGVRVGPGGDRSWTPVLIDDSTDWVNGFAGLWGRDTGDRFGGERAPAGPRYERDGTVRPCWADPVGWAGLHKVPASDAAARRLLGERLDAVAAQLKRQAVDVADRRRRLAADGALLAAVRADPARSRLSSQLAEELDRGQRDLLRLSAEQAVLGEEAELIGRALAEPTRLTDPKAHLHRPHIPYQTPTRNRRRFLQIWSLLSIPFVLLAIAAVVAIPGLPALDTFLVIVAVCMGLEALARRRLLVLTLTCLGFLVGLALLIIVVVFLLSSWRYGAAALLATAAVAVLVANLRDAFGASG